MNVIPSISSNTYTYNNADIRLTKVENGYKHFYYYDGSRLIKEEVKDASNDALIRTLVFIKSNMDPRFLGWLGWQKNTYYNHSIEIHYVGNRLLPK